MQFSRQRKRENMDKPFRCPGICEGCGRCLASGLNAGAGDRKIKIIASDLMANTKYKKEMIN